MVAEFLRSQEGEITYLVTSELKEYFCTPKHHHAMSLVEGPDFSCCC
jgi:hypothetical protein